MPLDETEIRRFLTEELPDVETSEAYGYTFFFYRDERVMPFATLAVEDNEYDRVSDLNRPGVYRLNIGVRKETYRSMFPATESAHDYTALDRFMPHPDYAAQSWICILNPTQATFDQVRYLLREAHTLAQERYDRKTKSEP